MSGGRRGRGERRTNGVGERLLQIGLLARLVALAQEPIGVLGEQLRAFARRRARLVPVNKFAAGLSRSSGQRVADDREHRADTHLVQRGDETRVAAESLVNKSRVLLVDREERVNVGLGVLGAGRGSVARQAGEREVESTDGALSLGRAGGLLDALEAGLLDVKLKSFSKGVEAVRDAGKEEVHALEVGLLLLVEQLRAGYVSFQARVAVRVRTAGDIRAETPPA